MKIEQLKENKEVYIKFRVTKNQREFIKYISNLKKMTVSEYILNLIKEDIEKNKCVE